MMNNGITTMLSLNEASYDKEKKIWDTLVQRRKKAKIGNYKYMGIYKLVAIEDYTVSTPDNLESIIRFINEIARSRETNGE